MVLLAAATGLRPGELIALEHRDVDRAARLLHVRRAFRLNRVKCTKTDHARAVPLQRRALEALDHLPTSASTLLFPAPEGGHLARDGIQHAVATLDAATSTVDAGGRSVDAAHDSDDPRRNPDLPR